jgi:hypothetical protein
VIPKCEDRFSGKIMLKDKARLAEDGNGSNSRKETAMTKADKSTVARRDFLRVLATGAGAAAVSAAPLATPAAADTESNDEKRKSRYQANSADVQNYYRVNQYPK